METLFVEVLKLCALAGLVKVGTIALDGTKVKANASRHKAMSYERMQEEEKRLKEEVARLLAEAEATDASEDAAHGPDRSGDELPEELARRQSRLAKIQQAKAELEERARREAAEEAARRQAEGKATSGHGPGRCRSRTQGPDQLHRPRVADHEGLEQGVGPMRQRPGRGQ